MEEIKVWFSAYVLLFFALVFFFFFSFFFAPLSNAWNHPSNKTGTTDFQNHLHKRSWTELP